LVSIKSKMNIEKFVKNKNLLHFDILLRDEFTLIRILGLID